MSSPAGMAATADRRRFPLVLFVVVSATVFTLAKLHLARPEAGGRGRRGEGRRRLPRRDVLRASARAATASAARAAASAPGWRARRSRSPRRRRRSTTAAARCRPGSSGAAGRGRARLPGDDPSALRATGPPGRASRRPSRRPLGVLPRRRRELPRRRGERLRRARARYPFIAFPPRGLEAALHAPEVERGLNAGGRQRARDDEPVPRHQRRDQQPDGREDDGGGSQAKRSLV